MQDNNLNNDSIIIDIFTGDEKSIKSISKYNSPSIINESEISNGILNEVDNQHNLNAVNKHTVKVPVCDH